MINPVKFGALYFFSPIKMGDVATLGYDAPTKWPEAFYKLTHDDGFLSKQKHATIELNFDPITGKTIDKASKNPFVVGITNKGHCDFVDFLTWYREQLKAGANFESSETNQAFLTWLAGKKYLSYEHPFLHTKHFLSQNMYLA